MKFFVVGLACLCLFAATAEGFCPRYWFRRGRSNFCYRFLESPLGRTWNNADISCKSVGGMLLTVTAGTEKTWIEEQLVIRNRTDDTRNWWTNLRKRNGEWQWGNGADVNPSFVNWAPGEPTNRTNLNCGRLDLGLGYSARSCNNRQGYVCKRKLDVPTPCPYGWEMYEDMCYRAKTNALPWADARESCRRDDGDLVQSRRIETCRVVRDFADYFESDLWVGLKSSRVGGVTQWMWSDGVESNQGNTNWVDGQPQIDNGQEENTCGMSLRTGSNGKLFSTSRCTESKPFVCERPVGTCEDGWRNHLGFCYKWVGASSFNGAVRRCRQMGAHMLTITSQNEQDYINTILVDLHDQGRFFLWTGLSAENGQPWTWSDGTVLTSNLYKNWGSGEPIKVGGVKNCAIMFSGNKEGEWTSTHKCGQSRNFICKIPEGVPVIEITTTPVNYQCEDGWTLMGDKCHMINETETTWPLARKECQNKGGDLAVVKNDEMTDFLIDNLNRDAWIGLHKRNSVNNFTWLDETTVSTYWNWAPGEPNNFNEEEDCVEVWTGQQTIGMWNDRRCNNPNSFICSKNAYYQAATSPASTPDEGWTERCGVDWVDHIGSPHCYQFHQEYVSWQDARDTCRDYGGELLTLVNPEEQAYVSARTSSMGPMSYWIGISDRTDNGRLSWADGSPLPYFNWVEGHPDTTDNKHCGVYQVASHAWELKQCTSKYGYICRKQAMSMVPTTPVPVTPTPKPGFEMRCRTVEGENWMEYMGNCYLFVERQAISWTNARTSCAARVADLASVGSEDENAFLMATAADLFGTSGQFWIGMEDFRGRDLYEWTDRSDVTYTNWDYNEPNNHRGNREECVDMKMGNGRWNDNSCSNTLNYLKGYVCKTPVEELPITTVPPSPTAPNGCPEGTRWLYRTKCITINQTMQSFEDAKASCEAWGEGASLLTVLDQYIQAFMGTRLETNSGQHWIGFSNRGNQDREWKWVNGDVSDRDYTHWDPSFTGNEINRCAFMRTSKTMLGLWKPQNCDTKYRSICSVGKFGFSTPVPTLPPSPCLDGWVNRNYWCYKVGFDGNTPNLRLPWSDALAQCRLQDADLASLHSRAEKNFILENVGDAQSKYWTGLHNNSGDQLWSDETGLDYTNWKGGQPNSHMGQENCVTMDFGGDGGWEYQSCNVAMNWVCKRRRGRPAPTGIPPVPTEAPCAADKFVLKHSSAQALSSGCQAVSVTVAASLDDCKSKTCLAGGNTFNFRSNTRLCDIRKCTGGDLETSDSTNSEDVYAIDGPSCDEPGWKYYNDFCWYVAPEDPGHNAVSFFEAHDKCADIGGRLASIHSDDENAVITQLTSRTSHRLLWFGLNRLDLGSWKWSDESPVEFINWARGEPNDYHYGQLCVNFYSFSGFWNDDNCADPGGYICKKRKGDTTAPTTPATSPVPGYCPAGFYGINNKCFKVFGRDDESERVTWETAVQTCRALGPWYDLSSISNKDEQALVNVLLDGIQANTWIGLNTRVHNQKQWVDNSAISYENWAPGEPNGQGGEEQCVEVYHRERLGEWNDVDCLNQRAYLCQFRKHMEGVVSTTINPFPESCDKEGYQNYLGECYKAVSTRTTWSAASDACKADGGDLVSIHSIQENSFVQYFMKDPAFNPHWIGLNDIESTGSFVWSNNWFVNFTRWGPGQPVVNSVQRCVAFHADGTWSVENCDTAMPTICKLITHPAPTPPVALPGRCPFGTWSPFYRHCYVAEANLQDTMSNAELECGHRGGQLASVHSLVENFYIRGKLISAGINHNIWLGLIRPQGNVQSWRWTDGAPVEFFHWAPGEPSDSTGAVENCVEMYADSGLWNDVRCDDNLRWMCKTDKELYTTIGTTLMPIGSSTAGQGSSAVSPGSTTPYVPGTPSRTSIPPGGTGTPRPSQGAPGPSGLGSGGIAGVVIGVVAIALVLLLVGLVFLRRRNQIPSQLTTAIEQAGISNILYFGNTNKATEA